MNMEIKISINISRKPKPVSNNVTNSYEKAFREELLFDSICSLNQNLQDFNRRFLRFEKKVAKINPVEQVGEALKESVNTIKIDYDS